jgi:peptide deformylase
MKIIRHPNKNLRTKCTLTSDAKNTLLALEEALTTTSGQYRGVGLAANQIGILERVCIIRHLDKKIDLINPVIIAHGTERKDSEEGCLSIDDTRIFNIKRWESVVVKMDNYPRILEVDNFEIARVIQHELDHLDGKLIIDYQKVGRNDPCLCGSGLKHKKCCGRKE